MRDSSNGTERNPRAILDGDHVAGQCPGRSRSFTLTRGHRHAWEGARPSPWKEEGGFVGRPGRSPWIGEGATCPGPVEESGHGSHGHALGRRTFHRILDGEEGIDGPCSCPGHRSHHGHRHGRIRGRNHRHHARSLGEEVRLEEEATGETTRHVSYASMMSEAMRDETHVINDYVNLASTDGLSGETVHGLLGLAQASVLENSIQRVDIYSASPTSNQVCVRLTPLRRG